MEVETQPETNIAGVMAKSAVLVSGDDDNIQIPNIVTNPQPQTENPPAPQPKVEPTSAAAPKETPVAVKETPAAPAPVAQESPKQEAPKAAEPVKWQEVLKQQPDTEVLKELGYDDKVINLLNHYKSKGDVKPWLEALTVDYKGMSDEDVMRHQLQNEFPELNREELNDLYETRVQHRYKLDTELYNEKEVKLGKIELKADAGKARAAMIARQQDFLLKPPPEQQPSKVEIEYNRLKEAQKQAAEAYEKHISESPVFKDFVQNKKVTVGEGEAAYNHVVADPNKTLNVLHDGSVLGQKLKNPDGTWNDKKQLLFSAFLEDMDGFLDNFARHHQEIGGKKALAPIENASAPVGTPVRTGETPVTDPAAAMAKSGVLVSG